MSYTQYHEKARQPWPDIPSPIPDGDKWVVAPWWVGALLFAWFVIGVVGVVVIGAILGIVGAVAWLTFGLLTGIR